MTPAACSIRSRSDTPASPRPARELVAISASITAAVRIRRLTGEPPIRPTPTSLYPKRWRRNQGGKPLRKRPEPVQINRTTSVVIVMFKTMALSALYKLSHDQIEYQVRNQLSFMLFLDLNGHKSRYEYMVSLASLTATPPRGCVRKKLG